MVPSIHTHICFLPFISPSTPSPPILHPAESHFHQLCSFHPLFNSHLSASLDPFIHPSIDLPVHCCMLQLNSNQLNALLVLFHLTLIYVQFFKMSPLHKWKCPLTSQWCAVLSVHCLVLVGLMWNHAEKIQWPGNVHFKQKNPPKITESLDKPNHPMQWKQGSCYVMVIGSY